MVFFFFWVPFLFLFIPVLFYFSFLFPYQWFQGCIVSVNVTGVSWLVIFFSFSFLLIALLMVPYYIILHDLLYSRVNVRVFE